MSRVEGNREVIKEIAKVPAKDLTSPKCSLACIIPLLADISISLATIADALYEPDQETETKSEGGEF